MSSKKKKKHIFIFLNKTQAISLTLNKINRIDYNKRKANSYESC